MQIKIYRSRFSLLSCSVREKFENTLEMSEKTEGILSKCGSLSKMATLNQDEAPASPPLLEKTLSP